MIAAIYARKSTEQIGTADEEKSVARQIEHARAYATRKGWTVADEHVYLDDDISGAEFVKRPGFLRLLNAVECRAPFQVLIMSEESRLGRESIETGWTLKKITDAGVRVFYYLEDRERTLDSAMDKVMMHLSTFAAEMEREKGVQRTRDAMQRIASRGHVAGGRVYGYRNVEVMNGDKRSHVVREIVPAEAAIIRRIFDEIAQGRGFAKIAQGLNRDSIPSPRAGRHWAMTGVREMVFRELYCGEVVYGKTRWADKGGTKIKVDVPEAKWLRFEAPELRIIPEELWRTAHARLDRTRQIYLRRNGGKLWGRPEAGIEARHLLSGFVVCGACGGAMHAIKRTSRRGTPRVYYVCNAWRVDGACANAQSAHLPDLDAAVLSCLRQEVLTPDVVEAVIARAAELYRSEPDATEERRERLAKEAERLQAELSRLTEAIRLGGPLASLVAEVASLERRRAEVLARLEHLDGLAKAPAWGANVRAEVGRRLTDWHATLGRQPAVARQILRKLLVGRLVLTPKATGEGRWYEFTGRASYDALLAGVVGLVPPG